MGCRRPRPERRGFFRCDAPNRNGARHCCQAPLRRALDLPVFVTLIDQARKPLQPVLDPGAPAQASLPTTAVRRPGSLFGSAPERASPPKSPPLGPKASATLMFHGPSWAGSLPRGFVSLGGKLPSYKEAPALPAPLADGPEFTSLRHRPEGQFCFEPHSIACRRRSVLPSLAAPSCRCRPSGEAGTSVPITIGTCIANPSRAKRNLWPRACG